MNVVFRALGPTHTRGDTIVFVEQDRVLFAGDIVMSQRFLAFGAQSSGETWLKVLDQLEALRPERIVPSHGVMGGESLIARQRMVLMQVRTRVGELKAQGLSVDNVASTVTSELQAKYPLLDDAESRRGGGTVVLLGGEVGAIRLLGGGFSVRSSIRQPRFPMARIVLSDSASAGKNVSIRSSWSVTSCGVPSVMIVLNNRTSISPRRMCTGSRTSAGFSGC